MEPKQNSCDKSPSRLARYHSFIARTLECYNQRGINELRGRQIRACFHGWVILSNQPDSILWSLWNPLTSKFIRLPPLIRTKTAHYECCLSSSPDIQGSIFMLLPLRNTTIVFCRLDRKRKRLKWTEMSYAKQLQSIGGLNFFLSQPTCCNGKVYALVIDYWYCWFVTQVDIKVRDKGVDISLRRIAELQETTPILLKGSSTDLFYIKLYVKEDNEKRISETHLFKLDTTTSPIKWEIIVDLEDAIFFIQFNDLYYAFYKSAVSSDIGGCAYLFNDIDKIISYHVKDRIMSIPSVPGIARENQLLAWAMLECGLEVDLHQSKLEDLYNDHQIIERPVNDEYSSTTSESRLLSVPFHVLEMIMECCVGAEYMNFRATCNRCRYAATSKPWNNKATSKRWQIYSQVSPWFMLLVNHRGIITFIDPMSGGKYFIKTPPELHDVFKIYCSKHGWLLMCNNDGSVVFYNPFKRDIRKLPGDYCFEHLCFSAPPTSPDCMVVGFAERQPHAVHICSQFVSQKPVWRSCPLNFNIFKHAFNSLTFSGRDVYVLLDNERILALKNLVEENFSWFIAVDQVPRSCGKYPTRYTLSTCDQQLLLVVVGGSEEYVEVFKLKASTNEWEKIDSLGKHVIYISDASCIYLEAKSLEMGNKIYFPRRLENDDTKMVFYSLETGRYHTCSDKNIQESFGVDLLKICHHFDAQTWINPCWS